MTAVLNEGEKKCSLIYNKPSDCLINLFQAMDQVIIFILLAAKVLSFLLLHLPDVRLVIRI